MRKVLFFLLFVAGSGFSLFGDDLTGFWQTYDSQTKKPESVIAVYPYQGKYYGRILGSYNRNGMLDDTVYYPQKRATGLVGNPYYAGTDIVINAGPCNDGKCRGYVIDPRAGKAYKAVLWKENGNLILRGEVFIFGKNMTWTPYNNFNEYFPRPDLSKFVPNVPRLMGG